MNEARKRGIKAGALRLRLFRPFPTDELIEMISDMKTVAVIDRAVSLGQQSKDL